MGLLIFLFVTGCVMLLLMFIALLTTVNNIANREKIENEYDYFYNLVNRYTDVVKIIGDHYLTGNMKGKSIKETYSIPVKFTNCLESEDMLYLFDGNNKLFAVCDKKRSKTYLTSFKRANKLIQEYENKYRKETEESTLF